MVVVEIPTFTITTEVLRIQRSQEHSFIREQWWIANWQLLSDERISFHTCIADQLITMRMVQAEIHISSRETEVSNTAQENRNISRRLLLQILEVGQRMSSICWTDKTKSRSVAVPIDNAKILKVTFWIRTQCLSFRETTTWRRWKISSITSSSTWALNKKESLKCSQQCREKTGKNQKFCNRMALIKFTNSMRNEQLNSHYSKTIRIIPPWKTSIPT